jgi:tRNA-2-methylthio-N6-dimethylallyladenosine synthase
MLIDSAYEGHEAINVMLSREETYADISPVRPGSNGVSAFISIMRGCNNMCAYCVVPFVRGTERSRDPETIVSEARDIFAQGYREVTLLGQNVNSYSWTGNDQQTTNFPSFVRRGVPTTSRDGVASRVSNQNIIDFAELLDLVASISSTLRIRFSTSHPGDLSDEVLQVIAKHENICKHIHLPVQSGSSTVLKRMNRKYTREWYLDRIAAINRIVPGCTVSTDIIAGFCGETEEEHQETLSLMREAGFDFAYMFRYSERPDTKAARHLKDVVPDKVKTRRLNEIIALQNELSAISKKADIGKTFEVLVEGKAKKPAGALMGRTTGNKVVVFVSDNAKPGDYVKVQITSATSATLIGEVRSV